MDCAIYECGCDSSCRLLSLTRFSASDDNTDRDTGYICVKRQSASRVWLTEVQWRVFFVSTSSSNCLSLIRVLFLSACTRDVDITTPTVRHTSKQTSSTFFYRRNSLIIVLFSEVVAVRKFGQGHLSNLVLEIAIFDQVAVSQKMVRDGDIVNTVNNNCNLRTT